MPIFCPLPSVNVVISGGRVEPGDGVGVDSGAGVGDSGAGVGIFKSGLGVGVDSGVTVGSSKSPPTISSLTNLNASSIDFPPPHLGFYFICKRFA